MFRLKGKQRGFTLVELIIVMAILGVLAAVVIPQVTGFLGESKEKSWETDQSNLETAVDAYYASEGSRPILGTALGVPVDNEPDGTIDTENGIIDLSELVTAGLIKTDASVQSADGANMNGSSTGSYVWYIDANKEVESWYWDGDTSTWEDGFQTNIYP